ncbi:hypothetical protein [Leucobacter sp. M11]|uniref:hypothetical protein n=1 Tax=Leucobacter sp. M11 TaxID=2993565 RepID=UPI002D7ED00E|nr:hypothetical protein [Leucobacter sp. M11]MEB4615911.1 hypothetical protein [Leucobacter sp. M11]
MTLPSEPVGSLPRPARLQRAVLDAEAGLLDPAELRVEQDRAVDDTLARFAETGSAVITDGEQRRQSFASYPLHAPEAEDASGRGAAGADSRALIDHTRPTLFAVFADGHHRVIPRLAAGPFHYRSLAAEHLGYARARTDLPLKQAVVSASMLSLMYPRDEPIADYPEERFRDDLVAEAERDIRACFAGGAGRVSIDFTEGRLALREDAAHGWAGRAKLTEFIDLNNRVLDRFSPAERDRIGVHTCPGGDRDSAHSADVAYAELIPELFQLRAGYFLVQAQSEPDRDGLGALIGRQLRQLAGAGRAVPRVLLGVTNPLNPRLETAEEVRAQLVAAARFIPAESLGSSDDCGFSPYLVDEKPRHGSPDFAREVAFAKIAARVRGTQLAADELSGGAS